MAIGRRKRKHIAIAFWSEKEQSYYLYSSLSLLRASKSDNYCCRNSWKSDNYMGSKREKSNIAIAILDK